MTPTLLGRWQTRLLLLSVIGIPITTLFAISADSRLPFFSLWWVIIFGFGWDALYNQLQNRRWDRDWPPALQLAAGVTELVWLAIFVYWIVPIPNPNLPQFLLHYSTIWIAVFLASQSVMRLVFPRWRFRGGQWI
ncbi:MAG: hypothetical protein ACPG8W_22395 [Candidatus Promineifilaceae bacterium]